MTTKIYINHLKINVKLIYVTFKDSVRTAQQTHSTLIIKLIS